MLKEIHEQPKAVRDTLAGKIALNKEIKLLDSFSYYEYLVSKEDYEELFNTYDLDYLFKNNKEEIPWFVKKIKK